MKRSAKETADELTDCLDFLIRDTRLRLYKFIESRIQPEGIPLEDLVSAAGALPQRGHHPARGLGGSWDSATRMPALIVQMMQRQRLVERRPSRVDKRRIDLYLTPPAGKKMASRTLRQMRVVNARIVAGFSASEARVLQTLLLRAHENLEPS